MQIRYASQKHEQFYNDCVARANCAGDSYREALFYALGITDETRRHIGDIYDFEERGITPEKAFGPWQTGTSIKITRLALNLYNGYCGEDDDVGEPDRYTLYEIFANTFAEYCMEAVRVRYSRYCNTSADVDYGYTAADEEEPPDRR